MNATVSDQVRRALTVGVLFHPSLTEWEVFDVLEDEAVYASDIRTASQMIGMVEVEDPLFLRAGIAAAATGVSTTIDATRTGKSIAPAMMPQPT